MSRKTARKSGRPSCACIRLFDGQMPFQPAGNIPKHIQMVEFIEDFVPAVLVKDHIHILLPRGMVHARHTAHAVAIAADRVFIPGDEQDGQLMRGRPEAPGMVRPLLIGGLILMIVFNLLGMFFGFGGAERLLCFAGVALFLAFTAYDVQKIKAMYAAYSYNPAILANASILAALQLYLDFVNLFLYILRLFGNRD